MWRTARKSSIFPLDLDSPNGSDRRSRCTEESNRGKPTASTSLPVLPLAASRCQAASPRQSETRSSLLNSTPELHPLHLANTTRMVVELSLFRVLSHRTFASNTTSLVLSHTDLDSSYCHPPPAAHLPLCPSQGSSQRRLTSHRHPLNRPSLSRLSFSLFLHRHSKW